MGQWAQAEMHSPELTTIAPPHDVLADTKWFGQVYDVRAFNQLTTLWIKSILSARGVPLRRSDKIRQIYSELRSTGVEGSASDLIKIANAILRTYAGEEDSDDFLSAPVDSKSFVDRSVDNAMADGGWRILEFEETRRRSIDDCSITELREIRRKAHKLIGNTWHHQPPVD